MATELALHLMHAVLDDVADRDDADEPALIDDRHVAELSGRHALHDAGDGFALVAGLDLARHRAADRLVEHGSAALGERTHDVAFGNDAGDAAVGAENQRGADTLLGENLDRLARLAPVRW